MKKSKNAFGDGCIDNIYLFLKLEEPKKAKDKEKELYNAVMREMGIKAIGKTKKLWLTDRYLTYKYLDKIKYGDFSEVKDEIKENINKTKSAKKFEPVDTKISLKEAYEMYKKQIKFEQNIKYVEESNIDSDALKMFNFIFDLYNKQGKYTKIMCKSMQYVFWEVVILGGKIVNFDFSAELLKHSLLINPSNLYITGGEVIQKLQKDEIFLSQINDIVKETEKSNKTNINIDKPITLENSDLFYSINNATLTVNGTKSSGKWNLKIRLYDTYDYTKLKTKDEYYNSTNNTLKSVFSSTLYNFAYFSMKANVLNEFDVYIEFEMQSYEV